MNDELEPQLRRIEQAVAEMLKAVRNLKRDRGAGPGDAAELNERLRRFLEGKRRNVGWDR